MKKIMIVMSDGKPVGDGNENQRLCDVTAFLESQEDMNLIGLGICTNVVEKFYTNHVVVHSLDQLSTTAMDQISRILMGRRLRGLDAA
jgi:cobalamin biosynthesis protein CobT